MRAAEEEHFSLRGDGLFQLPEVEGIEVPFSFQRASDQFSIREQRGDQEGRVDRRRSEDFLLRIRESPADNV